MTKNERLMMIGMLRLNGYLATSIGQVAGKLDSVESINEFKTTIEDTMKQFNKIVELMEKEWAADDER